MGAKYDRKDIDQAKSILKAHSLPRDAFPYTEDFDKIYQQFCRSRGSDISKHSFWLLLGRAGKEGGAGNKGKAPHAPALTKEEAFEMLRLCPDGIGGRDRLPYTSEFDEIHRLFTAHTGRHLSKHDFWRALSSLAKRSRKPKPLDLTITQAGIPQALEEHLLRMNPWWRGEYGKEVPPKRRAIYTVIFRRLMGNFEQGTAVRGPRQVGKTTLQKQIIKDMLLTRGATPETIIYVQFDDLPSLGSLAEPVLAITQWYERVILKRSMNESARGGKTPYVFIDEVQNLKAWDSQIKALIDHNSCKVFITGSSALKIHQGRENLAGRVKIMDLGPLHLPEIASIRGLGNLTCYQPDLDISEWKNPDFWEGLSRFTGGTPLFLEQVFEQFSESGGYPFCHEDPSRTWVELARYLLDVVVTRTIQHDIRVGGAARDHSLLTEVFKLALRYAGQAPKCSTLSKEIASLLERPITPSEVREYLDFLQNSLLIRVVPVTQFRLKKQTSSGKICIADHAVRAALLQEKVSLHDIENTAGGKDLAGRIMESIIGYYLCGFNDLDVAHFPERSTEPEVDYVLTIGETRIPVEVKYRDNARSEDNLKGLISFLSKRHYNAKFGILVTQDESGKIGNNIFAIPAKRFLLLN